MSKTSRADPGAADVQRTHRADHRDIRRGDVCRVNGVDGLEAIAKWPWTQEDFNPSRHPEIPTETRYDTDQRDDVIRKQNGVRTSFATEDGTVYALVDWSQTDDPPYLYLLVINGSDPDQRRWDRVGEVTEVERYGPEPSYRMSPVQWKGTRENHLTVLDHAARGEFADTSLSIPDASELRTLADTRSEDDPAPLTREDIQTLNTVYDAASEHVDQTGDTILTDDPQRDLKALDTTLTPYRMTALFPTEDGDWLERPCSWTGPPSSDVEPWTRETRSELVMG